MENVSTADLSIKAKIARQIYEAVRKLDAKSDLVPILGSYSDTLHDEDVLLRLTQWNESHGSVHRADPNPEDPLIPRGIG